MALFVATFLANVQLLGLSCVPKCTPCARTMRNIILQAAADSIILEKQIIHSLPLTILADKGDGKGRRDGANFVKLIGKYSHKREEVDATK